MKKKETNIEGLFIVENNFLHDERGGFMEIWHKDKFKKFELLANFTQDNLSISKKNTLRGLHFQNQPHGQTKYVNVLRGKVLDVVVDIRKYSQTFGKYFSIELSDKNKYGLWIPSGLAHGFLSLQENTIFHYKCAGKYNPKHEHTIQWNDKDIDIDWGTNQPIISKKDSNGISLKEYKNNQNINA